MSLHSVLGGGRDPLDVTSLPEGCADSSIFMRGLKEFMNIHALVIIFLRPSDLPDLYDCVVCAYHPSSIHPRSLILIVTDIVCALKSV